SGGDIPVLLRQGPSKRSKPLVQAVFAGKGKAAYAMEQACVLCRRAEADPHICGNKFEKNGLYAHACCLWFANGLRSLQDEREWLVFLLRDVRRAAERAAQQECFVCGESGAAITCWETGCDRSFHLPCAAEGECVTQYFAPFRSFCWEHRPEQTVEATPEEDTSCLLCLELVEEMKSYGTMVCPACKHAWFHRGCIQGQAVHGGFSLFQCPLCRDRDLFRKEMLTMGIRVPK
ncbi:PREDICTED: G2/M phase-specific E3 ubiquitin-protein ligase-like, partial [Buceros rhinoceros silvestris]|uniref:G2/M phase-specific E3 ubiquitin-protein ligase-like n=1 Tax=Buceros rhinoceros silvestris TaxID=175836 RepID=UPI0005289F7F